MWVVSDFTLLSVHHVHHVCSLHLSDIMCIVFTSYQCIVHVSCVSCVYVLFVYHVYCMSRDQNINISYPSFPNRRSIYHLLLNVSLPSVKAKWNIQGPFSYLVECLKQRNMAKLSTHIPFQNQMTRRLLFRLFHLWNDQSWFSGSCFR